MESSNCHIRVIYYQFKRSTIRASWGKPFNQLIADILPSLDFQTFFTAYQRVMRQYPPEPTAGANTFLEYLHNQRVRLDVVTSSHQQLIQQDLENLGMLFYFDHIWGYEQTYPYFKPNSRVLEPILNELYIAGFEQSNIIYIGDSIRDYKVAVGNNLDFIAVTSGLEDSNLFLVEGLSEDRIITSLEFLMPLH